MLADRALTRMAGAPLIAGNRVRLLRDAAENYPAWMEAIRNATQSVDFETYVVHADEIGEQFADLLAAKAREGVVVRVIYDWLGALGAASFLFWRRMRKAGVQVRCFHPPRLDDPFAWFQRDHRKIIIVDGETGFVSGLCVGKAWTGDPQRGIAPWRDSGIQIEGPAVVDLSRAFARVWNSLGKGNPLPSDFQKPRHIPPAGDVALRIVAGDPGTGGLYRLDLLFTAMARRSIWLTDAYFYATPVYVQSLRAAARDGIDVRLLVPRTSDIPVVRALSRVGYRSLLEAGVRIFEWNGTMLHAKTAVADERWSRVGSTNLNIASWMGNYELDAVIENEDFARSMREAYLDDLDHATEIVLREGTRVAPNQRRRKQERRRPTRTSVGRAATGVAAIANTAGAALTRSRLLGPAEAPVMIAAACVLVALGLLMIFFPRVAAAAAGLGCGWLALVLLLRAWRLWRAGSEDRPKDL
ncbi:MAG: phospholipase D-like domain-containing protein [Acidobacteriota bacterium]